MSDNNTNNGDNRAAIIGKVALPESGESRRTSDIGLAAFAKTRGLTLKAVKRVPGRGRNEMQFTLDDPNKIFDSIILDWVNSPEKKFDDEIRSLKKLMSRYEA